jgi:6-phosphofructokinase 1
MTNYIFDNTPVRNLGDCNYKSPIPLSFKDSSIFANFVKDSERVLFDIDLENIKKHQDGIDSLPTFELAGPRKLLHFEPGTISCGIVTCGGLCPGINNVIRGLVNAMHYWYKCDKIYGFRYGYRGMIEDNEPKPMMLEPKNVEDIHLKGGTILGSSRGEQDTKRIVDHLVKLKISILFVIGGDGTMRGANEMCEEISSRNLDISVIGIPKTIDNDIIFVENTFGYQTAFSAAVEAINSAHVEAKGALNGIGIVKLMGRDSGYIAASASVASQDVNYVLVPESPFELEGRDGLLNLLKKRIKEKKHAVIVVAEGAAQDFFKDSEQNKDKSGNVLHKDIGIYLKDKISEFFKKEKIEFTIKYIDPSYMIRSLPPVPMDSMFCSTLAQNAAHAGMAGKTEVMIGYWNGKFTHVPIVSLVGKRKKINIESDFWLNVLLSTGQPRYMGDDITIKAKMR